MKLKSLIIPTGLIGAFTLSPLVQAQSDASSGITLEEVVVTAKQREQDLQEVPLSISVFNERELAELGVKDVRNLADFTPNFNIYSGNGRQDASAINVRGLSANTSDERYQPVSFFVDGIFMGGVTVGLQTIDVERVEVLKGPQSASFGRATYAGAIDFVTSTPSMEEIGGHVKLQTSSNTWDNTNVLYQAYVEGPLIEGRLSGSVYLQYQEDEGFDSAPGAQFDTVGTEETEAINAVLFAQLTESTTAKLRVIYSEEDDQEGIYHTTQPLYWQQEGANIVTLPSGALFIKGEVPDPIRDGIRGVDLPAHIANPRDGGYLRDRKFVSLIVEHELSGGQTFSYKGSWLENDLNQNVDFRGRSFVGVDPVFGPAQPTQPGESSFNFRFPFPFQEQFEETSHQFRIISADDQRLRWSAGVYFYESRDTNWRDRFDLSAPAGNPDRQTRGDENIDNQAIFGAIEYDFSDQFSVAFEGRYQKETVEFESLLSSVATNSRVERDIDEEETEFEPRLTLNYKPNEDHMFYALYSKGVKSGRYNTSTALPAQADGTRPAAGFVYAPPETLHNFEIGSKSTFLDGRMTLNAAIFWQEVEDQQLRQTVNLNADFDGDGQNDTLNAVFTAGDSEIFGFEVESKFQATENLLLSGAIGYADHEFVDDISPSADFDLFDYRGGRTLKGRTSVNVPKVTANASAVYSREVLDGLQWNVRGDVIYTGEKYVELANLAEIPDYYRVNLRTTLESESWTVSLFINNAFDDETAVGAGLTGTSTCEFERNGPNLPAFQDNPGTATDQRCIYLVPQRGREVGVSATFRF